MATTCIAPALRHFDVTVLGKPHAKLLLQPLFPQLQFVELEAPWTAFTGKYRVWRWNWRQLLRRIARLRRDRFDAAVSVREDPRDHLLMFLAGARRRFGFWRFGSAFFLTNPLRRNTAAQHRVQDWRQLAQALGIEGAAVSSPSLRSDRQPNNSVHVAQRKARPAICLHTGARIPVRRWPESFFAELIKGLRMKLTFDLTIIPDPDGYGLSLQVLADVFLPRLEIDQLVHVLGSSDLVICNDSAPSHIAAAQDVPVIALFGPTNPAWYRPWGSKHHVVIRDICPYRPCFDYCRFAQPYCLTKLRPAEVWLEIEQYVERLRQQNGLPQT